MYTLFLLSLTICHAVGLENIKENDGDSKTKLEAGKISCHNGWISLTPSGSGKHTYCIRALATFRMTWQQAEESCRQFGNDAHLISIENAEQIDGITKAIEMGMQIYTLSSHPWSPSNSPLFDFGWWIGLGQLCPSHNISQMPILRWTDGGLFDNNKLTIGDMKLTVPKADKWDGHYCVSFHYEKSDGETESNKMFNLTECTDRRSFICQMPAFLQDRTSHGEILAEEEIRDIKNDDNELSEEFPCGKDPLYCPLKTDQGTVCYHLDTQLNYWEKASEQCDVQYQSDLASIHSKEEVDFIYQMIKLQPSVSGETKYWIGLHRRNALSQYEWSDGSSFDFMVHRVENEDPSEESGACIAIQFNVSTRSLLIVPFYRMFGIPVPITRTLRAYAWIHQRCDNHHPAICRKPGFDYHYAYSKSAKEERRLQKRKYWKCSNGYQLFGGMCYKVYGTKNHGATFSEAIRRCKNEKASLVSISDFYENGFVVSILKRLKSNAWIGMDMSDGRVRWLDGEPLKLIRFSPDNRIIRISNDRYIFQKSGGFSYEACVALDATDMIGYWDIIFNQTVVAGSSSTNVEKQSKAIGQCESINLPYVCETYAEESSEVQRKRLCYEIDDIVYCFLANDPNKDANDYYSFMSASEVCAAYPKVNKNFHGYYGQLAQVDNLFEWLFLTAIALENDYDELFMGVRFRKSIGFERLDKLRLHLAPWGVGEPNLKNGDCVMLKIAKDGPAWYMEDCNRHKPVVCRLTKEQPMSEIPQTVRCPDGKEDWILGETHCYYLVSNISLISSGYKADHDCFKYFNGSLASFETRRDFALFRSHILHNQLFVSSAIIGLIRQQHGSYAWKDSSPVTFLNWADGEPVDEKDRITQQCVQMQLNGNYSWRSVSCWQTRHFLCSVPVVNVYENPTSDKADVSPSLSQSDKKHGQNGEQEKNKREELIGGRAGKRNRNNDDSQTASSSPTIASPSSLIGTIMGISVFLTAVAVTTFSAYRLRQKRRLRLSNQRIIQFDSLQNEEENGI